MQTEIFVLPLLLTFLHQTLDFALGVLTLAKRIQHLESDVGDWETNLSKLEINCQPHTMEVQKIYAIRHGFRRGLFRSWEECKQQVSGYYGAEFRRFRSLDFPSRCRTLMPL